jgi:hypothetical protein
LSELDAYIRAAKARASSRYKPSSRSDPARSERTNIFMIRLSIEHDVSLIRVCVMKKRSRRGVRFLVRSLSHPCSDGKTPALGMQCRFRISREQSKIQKITCEDSRSCRQIQACATVVDCNALSVFILHQIFPLDYTNCARKSRASESRHFVYRSALV